MKLYIPTILFTIFLINTASSSLLLVKHIPHQHARKLMDGDSGPDVTVQNMDMFTNTLHSINSDLETDRGILSMAKRQAYATLDDVIGKMSAKANESPMDHFLSMHQQEGEEEDDEDDRRKRRMQK